MKAWAIMWGGYQLGWAGLGEAGGPCSLGWAAAAASLGPVSSVLYTDNTARGYTEYRLQAHATLEQQ